MSTVHVLPVNDLIDHEEDDGCPSVVPQLNPTHHSLDGREFGE